MSPGHHENHGSNYSNDPWIGLGGYANTGPQHTNHGHNDYQGFDYSSSTPMPMEPTYPMSRPPPYATPQQMPPPLVMPQHNHVWPSMLANSTSYQQPILPAISIQTPLSATSIGSDLTPTSAKTSTSRRKLTDDERRLMCLEAENNPSMKQTQIGAKFNVERSTVSKILRQRDKYMKPHPKEEATSPGKKTKLKLPDVEKTLVNWARNQQKHGRPVNTDELRKQVLMFTSGRNDQQSFTTTEWLEKFQKRHLSGHPKHGSRDDTTETANSYSERLDDSPTSSNGLVSPPMSAIEAAGHYRTGRSDDVFDFDAVEYDHSPSLPHGFSSDAGASSEALLSPVSPETTHDDFISPFSEDTTIDLNYPRQRSMTLPHLSADSRSRPASSQMSVPTVPVRSMTTSNEHRQASVDPRQTMKRHKSVPDIHDSESVRYSTMQPPPLPRSADISPVGMSASPSHQDETIVALHNIKRLLEQRPDVAEPDDYVMIGKLMEKLKLLRSRSPTGTPILPGGMHAIDMSDSPRLSKKRTMFEMSM